MIETGFSVDDIDTFIEEVTNLHAEDVKRVLSVQQALMMTDEGMVDLAQTIFRVLQ